MTEALAVAQPMPAQEPRSLLAVVERAATNPEIDLEKMKALVQMAREERAYNAELSFNDAMNRAQAEIGRVVADRENSQTRSSYATYAALDRAVRPAYVKEGFSLSFNTGEAPEGAVCVLCYVSHKDGHTRNYQAVVPADGKGAKGGDVMTKTHAFGSGVSYGKRYLLKMIFNVAEGVDPDDDDGNGATDSDDSAVSDPIYDKIDLSESHDELRKVKPEIEAAKVGGATKRGLIQAYNKKLKLLNGEPMK